MEQFIVFLWELFLVYLIISAFSVKRKRTVEYAGLWNGIIWRFIIVFIIIIFIASYHGGVAKLSKWILWQETFAIGIIADLIALAGFIVVVWARTTLGGNWSPTVALKENHEIIKRGPYAYVRHPMYSGLLLMALGTAIFFGHAFGFVLFLFFLIAFFTRAKGEEKLLSKHFPEEYPEYKKKTKMLIPFVW